MRDGSDSVDIASTQTAQHGSHRPMTKIKNGGPMT